MLATLQERPYSSEQLDQWNANNSLKQDVVRMIIQVHQICFEYLKQYLDSNESRMKYTLQPFQEIMMYD